MKKKNQSNKKTRFHLSPFISNSPRVPDRAVQRQGRRPAFQRARRGAAAQRQRDSELALGRGRKRVNCQDQQYR